MARDTKRVSVPTTDILLPEECAALLRVDLSWIYEKSRKRQHNPLPTYRIGRYLRFSKAAILAWLEGQSNDVARKIAKAVARG
ncbi:MAG: helix-turn-helix domain-containing protein [Candidatus Sulfotelmatobacter sp.]